MNESASELRCFGKMKRVTKIYGKRDGNEKSKSLMVKLEEDANGCCTASCCHCFWVSFFLCFGSGFGFIALTASMSAQEYPFVDLNGNALRGDTDAWNSNTCYNMKGKIGQDFVQGQEESGYDTICLSKVENMKQVS